MCLAGSRIVPGIDYFVTVSYWARTEGVRLAPRTVYGSGGLFMNPWSNRSTEHHGPCYDGSSFRTAGTDGRASRPPAIAPAPGRTP